MVGVSDVIELLTAFGDNYDIDGDGIADCEDDCIGMYDECEVCNGPGPQSLAIDTILVTLDSLFDPATQEWVVEIVDADTLLHLVCENIGCTDPQAENFDPYADPGGECVYPCGLDVLYNGHAYATVEIGSQCWFKENLRTAQYSNGSNIPAANDCGIGQIGWEFYITPSRTEYGSSGGALMGTCIPCNHFNPDFNACNPSQSLNEYGMLYNWYAVNDWRRLCPSGWYVPTDGDYKELRNFLSGPYPGRQMKSSYPAWDGTNTSGFSALAGGYRDHDGIFMDEGYLAFFWSSSADDDTGAWFWELESGEDAIYRPYYYQRSGFSVRCIRD